MIFYSVDYAVYPARFIGGRMNRINEYNSYLSQKDSPYERCILYGENNLSDIELLAVILKTGTKGMSCVELAKSILTMPNGEVSLLAIMHKSYQELIKIRGVKKSKALTIKCIGELAKRISLSKYSDNITFNSSKEVADYYMELMRHLDYEQTRLILLNGSNRLITSCVMTQGTVNQSLISSREIFQKAIEYSAVYIIIMHNHPGGNPNPGKADIQITREIYEAGKIMNIPLLDHIIIGNNSYFSMKDSGYF